MIIRILSKNSNISITNTNNKQKITKNRLGLAEGDATNF